jgi:hypothetical protein
VILLVCLNRLPKDAFNYFVLSLPVINFTVTIIICNIIVINNDERLQDPILLLKNPMGTRRNFSRNYLQFGHALSKKFASPGLG